MIFSGADTETGIARARKRISKMSSGDLLDWLDIALAGMMRHLDDYRRSGDFAHLAEVGLAESTINMVVSELLDRNLEDEIAKIKPRPRNRPEDYTEAFEAGARMRVLLNEPSPAQPLPWNDTQGSPRSGLDLPVRRPRA